MNVFQNKAVIVQDLGIIDFEEAWQYQQKLFEDIISQKLLNRNNNTDGILATKNFLLVCQHPHVYTLGKSGNIDNLLLTETELEKYNTKFYKINRGGDITYHGPGQLVIYPILDLENFFTDIHKYLRLLEQVVINTLSEFGINAGRVEGKTGVWVDTNTNNPRKICAMGIRSSRWVVMHGLALNVNTDLNFFERIVPCGISDKSVTSMASELGKNKEISKIKDALINNFANLFEMNFC